MPLAPYPTGRVYIIKDTSEEYDPSKYYGTDYTTESLAWEDIIRDRFMRGEASEEDIKSFYRSLFTVYDTAVFEKDRRKPYSTSSKEAAEKLREEMVAKRTKSMMASAKKLKKLLDGK